MITDEERGISDRLSTEHQEAIEAVARPSVQKVSIDEKGMMLPDRVLFSSDDELNDYAIELSGGSLGEPSFSFDPVIGLHKPGNRAYVPINGCFLLVPDENLTVAVPNLIVFGGYKVLEGYSNYFLYPEIILEIDREQMQVPASILPLGSLQQASALGVLYLALDIASLVAPAVATLKGMATLKAMRPNFFHAGTYLEFMAGTARKGGQKLSRAELNKIRMDLRKNSIELVIDSKPGLPKSRFLPPGALAGFNAGKKQLILRKGATFYEYLHESIHYKHYLEIGPEEYVKMAYLWGDDTARLYKEAYVFVELYKKRKLLTTAERRDMMQYLRKLIEEYKIATGQADLRYVRKIGPTG